MNTQFSVRLPEDLHNALRQVSRQSGMKSAEIVRQALREHLHLHPDHNAHRSPAARSAHLLGSLESGIPDLAERHREYLLAMLTRE